MLLCYSQRNHRGMDLSAGTGGKLPASQTPPPQPFAAWVPPPTWPQIAPPRGQPRNTQLIIAVVVIAVVLAVTLPIAAAWVLYWSVSQSLENGSQIHTISFNIQSSGGNWTMIVSFVSGNMNPSGTFMTIFDYNGQVKMPMSSVPLSSLTPANWNTYGVLYQKTSAGSYVGVGDTILVYKLSYPSGHRYQISDSSSIIASGQFM